MAPRKRSWKLTFKFPSLLLGKQQKPVPPDFPTEYTLEVEGSGFGVAVQRGFNQLYAGPLKGLIAHEATIIVRSTGKALGPKREMTPAQVEALRKLKPPDAPLAQDDLRVMCPHCGVDITEGSASDNLKHFRGECNDPNHKP